MIELWEAMGELKSYFIERKGVRRQCLIKRKRSGVSRIPEGGTLCRGEKTGVAVKEGNGQQEK